MGFRCETSPVAMTMTFGLSRINLSILLNLLVVEKYTSSKQTHLTPINYIDTVKLIINKDGMIGLFGRGLKTRIMINGLQGTIFTICWKFIQDDYFKK